MKSKKQHVKREKKDEAQNIVPVEMAVQARELYKAEGQTAEALGKVLLEVKKINPHGGLKKWITDVLGKGQNVLNRCNYCIRLVRKTKSGSAKKPVVDIERNELMKEFMEHVRELYKHAKEGNVGPATVEAGFIAGKAKEQVELAKLNEAEMAKKKPAFEVNLKDEQPKTRAAVSA